jgi:hypothetical protein
LEPAPTTLSRPCRKPRCSEEPVAADVASDEGSPFENGVLTTPDLKIEITRSKVIKPGAR